MGAYQQGLDSGSQYRLRSAQTETAMQQAEQNRAEAVRISQANAARTKALTDPTFAGSLAMATQIANGANDLGGWQDSDQIRGFRGTINDGTAAPDVRFRAGEAIQGQLQPKIEALGAGREYNMLTGEAYTNPIGDANIANYGEQGANGDYTANGVRYNRDGTRIGDINATAADAHAIAEAKRAPPKPAAAANMPAAVRNGFLENNALLDGIDAAIADVQESPDSFGLQNLMGDSINQRRDAAGVGPRAAVANIGSAKIHDRSGAAVTVKEMPRLAPFIPTATDRADAIVVKLQKMREALLAEQEGINGMYNMVPATLAAPSAAPAAAPAAGGEVTRSTSKSGKAIVSRDGGQTWEYE